MQGRAHAGRAQGGEKPSSYQPHGRWGGRGAVKLQTFTHAATLQCDALLCVTSTRVATNSQFDQLVV